jgi:hypothetical protein
MHSTYSFDEGKILAECIGVFKGNQTMCPGDHSNLKLKLSLAQSSVEQEELRFLLAQTTKLVWRTWKDVSTR